MFSQKQHRWLLGVGIAQVSVSLLLWQQGPIDDAYITFRYARNFAEGSGLVFNEGERVEGYSSLSWTLASAAIVHLGVDVTVFARVLGVLLALATTTLLASRSPVAALWMALYVPFAYHSVNGMETLLFTFLVSALILIPASATRSRIAVSILLTVTRPEGLLLVLGWAMLSALPDGNSSLASDARHRIRKATRIAAPALVTFVLHVSVRLIYYGHAIPNSAKAKLVPLATAVPQGLSYTASFLQSMAPVIVTAVLGALLAKREGPHRRKGRWVVLGEHSHLLFAVLYLAIVIRSGGDSFPLWRFVVPISPLLMLEGARGFDALLHRSRRSLTDCQFRSTRALTIVLMSLVVVSLSLGEVERMRQHTLFTSQMKALAQAIDESYASDTLIAVTAAGIVPFETALPTIDMLGLNDEYIAGVEPDLDNYLAGHVRYDHEYVLDRKPGVIVLANGPSVERSGDPFPWDQAAFYEQDFRSDDRFNDEYVVDYLMLDSGQYSVVFRRIDLGT